MSSVLRVIPLGGLGEVGRNMMLYEYQDQILIVDSGLMFPENDMMGVDYIIPDMTYVVQHAEQVCGIVITHGHEDHTGSIQHLLEITQAPIYATPLTRGLLEVKLARHGLVQRAMLNTVQAGETHQIGPFQVEFFHVCHSVPDGVGLGIETPAGLIVHSGDYKFDHTPVDNWPSDYAKLAEFSRRGVLALFADSTNAERAGWTPSERVVDAALDDVFRGAQGRIIIASFASLISRMQQIANVALRYHRKLAFAGPSMIDNAKMARKLGYLDIPDDLIISIEQALTLAADEVVIMCTGSQGEPTSILGRLSTGTNRLFDVREGDTIVLSSHPIPGNEENVYRTINRLFERGAKVIYEAIAPVHVSGHASQEEMKLLIHLTRPHFVIPMHGELRHLRQHAALAEQVGIPAERIAVLQNGQVIEFEDGKLRLAEEVPAAMVFVDGSGVGNVSLDVMREREELARDGVVMVQVVLDRYSGSQVQEPELRSQGFLMNGEANGLMAGARQKIADVLLRGNGNVNVARDLEKELANYLFGETRRRPVVMVSVVRV
jgi:ribonuclease J